MQNDLRLLAHVTNLEPAVADYVAKHEGKFPYQRQGYVDLDLGRHIQHTDAIRAATDGYALADKAGVVLQKYTQFAAAATAREGAVIRLAPDIATEGAVADTQPPAGRVFTQSSTDATAPAPGQAGVGL